MSSVCYSFLLHGGEVVVTPGSFVASCATLRELIELAASPLSGSSDEQPHSLPRVRADTLSLLVAAHEASLSDEGEGVGVSRVAELLRLRLLRAAAQPDEGKGKQPQTDPDAERWDATALADAVETSNFLGNGRLHSELCAAVAADLTCRDGAEIRQRFALPDDLAPEARAVVTQALVHAQPLSSEEAKAAAVECEGSWPMAALSPDSLRLLFTDLPHQQLQQAALSCCCWAVAACEEGASQVQRGAAFMQDVYMHPRALAVPVPTTDGASHSGPASWRMLAERHAKLCSRKGSVEELCWLLAVTLAVLTAADGTVLTPEQLSFASRLLAASETPQVSVKLKLRQQTLRGIQEAANAASQTVTLDADALPLLRSFTVAYTNWALAAAQFALLALGGEAGEDWHVADILADGCLVFFLSPCRDAVTKAIAAQRGSALALAASDAMNPEAARAPVEWLRKYRGVEVAALADADSDGTLCAVTLLLDVDPSAELPLLLPQPIQLAVTPDMLRKCVHLHAFASAYTVLGAQAVLLRCPAVCTPPTAQLVWQAAADSAADASWATGAGKTWMGTLNTGILFELILCTNALGFNELQGVVCQAVASMIAGKTPEEIRTTFNIRNDFTPEEEAAVRAENAWAWEA